MYVHNARERNIRGWLSLNLVGALPLAFRFAQRGEGSSQHHSRIGCDHHSRCAL